MRPSLKSQRSGKCNGRESPGRIARKASRFIERSPGTRVGYICVVNTGFMPEPDGIATTFGINIAVDIEHFDLDRCRHINVEHIGLLTIAAGHGGNEL